MTSLDSEHPGKPEHPGEIDLLNEPSGPIHQVREKAQIELEKTIAANDEASARAVELEPEQYEELVKRYKKDGARRIVEKMKKALRLSNTKIDPDLAYKRLQKKAEEEERDIRKDIDLPR